jgi:hypothetical protein
MNSVKQAGGEGGKHRDGRALLCTEYDKIKVFASMVST